MTLKASMTTRAMPDPMGGNYTHRWSCLGLGSELCAVGRLDEGQFGCDLLL